MDKMSLISVLFVSVPEELLFILMTALIVGRKDVLDFKISSNIIRVTAATALTVLCTFLLRYFSTNMMLNFVVQLIFFIAVYILFLRLKWYESTVGLMITLAIYIPVEILNNALVIGITGSTVEQTFASNFFRILYTVPERILQIAIVYILYKSSYTLIWFGNIEKLTKNIIKKFAIMHLYLLIAFLQMSMTIKYFMFDVEMKNAITHPFLWLNILCTIILVLILITTTKKLSNNIRFEKQEQVICLVWFNSLLKDYGSDISKIKKEIDEALKKYEGGLS